MPSTSDSRQPYRLSNLDLVTESLTLIAGNSSSPFFAHLVEAVHAGGGLFGHALDLAEPLRYQPGLGSRRFLIEAKSATSSSLVGLRDQRRVGLRLRAQVQQQRGVAAVVQDHVGALAVGPFEDAVRCSPSIPPASRPSRRTPACRPRRCGGGVVLGGEDVAGGPAHLGAERLQRLDQHRGLDGHVQRAGDARALQRLRRANSSRIAIRPGISVSAMSISLRPQSASAMSATM